MFSETSKIIIIEWKKNWVFYDIKSLFQKSVDKKLQIFNSIFLPFLLHFFDFFFIMILFHSAIISFDHIKKNIKFSLLLIKL